MTERPDIWKVADAIQMDLRAAQAKLTELRRMLAALPIPEPSSTRCPNCGAKVAGPNTLAEHLYVSHNGPLPPAYERAEALSQ